MFLNNEWIISLKLNLICEKIINKKAMNNQEISLVSQEGDNPFGIEEGLR